MSGETDPDDMHAGEGETSMMMKMCIRDRNWRMRRMYNPGRRETCEFLYFNGRPDGGSGHTDDRRSF